jgi:Fe-S-cluster containining protein
MKVYFLPFILLDLLAQKIARLLIKPPFVKEGHCLKRGNCCHYILLPQFRGPLGRLFLFWNTQINGFYPRYRDTFDYENKKMIVMGCRHLQKDGRCGDYLLRPAVCRQWPRIEYFGPPQMLKGCGFKAAPRHPLRILK